MSLPSTAPRPTCRYCANPVPSAAIHFCRACESKLPGGRVAAILTTSGMKVNQTDIDIAIEEAKAQIARNDGDERQALRHEHSAGLIKWRRDNKKAVERIELRPAAIQTKTPVIPPDVKEASDRIVHTLNQLKREGFALEVLKRACDEAQTRISNRKES